MKTVKEKIGNAMVCIQLVDEVIEISETGERKIQPTGIKSDLECLHTDTRSAIREIVEDMGKELKKIDAKFLPKQLELDFNVAMSAQVGPVILFGKGDVGWSIKCTWDFSINKES